MTMPKMIVMMRPMITPMLGDSESISVNCSVSINDSIVEFKISVIVSVVDVVAGVVGRIQISSVAIALLDSIFVRSKVPVSVVLSSGEKMLHVHSPAS